MSGVDTNSLMTAVGLAAAESAGSVFGGAVGAAVFSQYAGVILSVLGIQQGDQLTAVQTTVGEILAGLTTISTQVKDLMAIANWTPINTTIATALNTIGPAFMPLADILMDSGDSASRDQQLGSYLNLVELQSSAALLTQLANIHTTILGSSSGLTQEQSYLQAYLANFWSQFYGSAVNDDFPTAAGKIMGLFVALGRLQYSGSILLYNCYMHGSLYLPSEADAVMARLAANLKLQYGQFLADQPTMMALWNMTPKVAGTVNLHLSDPTAGDAAVYLDPFGTIYTRDTSFNSPTNSALIIYNTMTDPTKRTLASTVYQYKGDATAGAQLYSFTYVPDQNDPTRFTLYQGLGTNSFHDMMTVQTTPNVVTAPEVFDQLGRQTAPPQTATIYVPQPKVNSPGGKQAWFRLIPTATRDAYQIQLQNPTDFGLAAGTKLVLAYQASGLAGTFAQLVASGGSGLSGWIFEGTPQAQLIQWYSQFP